MISAFLWASSSPTRAVNTDCNLFASKLHAQLGGGRYKNCSVLPMPPSVEEWREGHRTARKRADRCGRLGYRFAYGFGRHEYVDDIFRINTSLPERQGKPMSEAYGRRPSSSPDPIYPCQRHGVHPYGVLDSRGHLRSYLWIYRSGELALVSSILGHGAHLRDDVMYLLWQGMLDHEIPLGGYVVYNRADSGTDGLRYYKEKVGRPGAHARRLETLMLDPLITLIIGFALAWALCAAGVLPL